MIMVGLPFTQRLHCTALFALVGKGAGMGYVVFAFVIFAETDFLHQAIQPFVALVVVFFVNQIHALPINHKVVLFGGGGQRAVGFE